MQRSALCRSRRELSNAYLFAKFGFDTAENEPCKVCPIERSGIGHARAAQVPGDRTRDCEGRWRRYEDPGDHGVGQREGDPSPHRHEPKLALTPS